MSRIWGARVWGASGSLELELTDSVTRYLGSITTGSSNGSFVDARLADGIPWFISQFNSADVNRPIPSFTISGTTISWTFISPGSPLLGSPQPATLYYGLR